MTSKPILIIDDDQDIQSAITMVLEFHGYKVHSVFNGQEAIDLFAKDEATPSLILLDLMMPVMDGFQFLKHFEMHPKASGIPVIVMTAAKNKAMEIKNYTTLLKPFDVKILLNLVGAHYQR